AYFISFEDQNITLRVIEEALSFVEDHGQWKFWKCYCCDEKFTDSELHFQHVVDKHLGRISPQLDLSDKNEILSILIETYLWYRDKISNNEILFDQKLLTSCAGFQFKESICLDGDSICLSFDEQLLQGGYNISERCTLDSSYFGENGASATFSIGGDQKDSGPPTSDDLLKWILDCPSIKEGLPATGGEALTSGTGVYALEIPEDGDDKTKTSLHKVITCFNETIDIELMKIEGMKTYDFFADDYSKLMATLVKNYIQAYLEKQADKNAAEKLKAEREEFSALVAADDKEKGDNQSKQLQKKSSKKKKRIGTNTASLKVPLRDHTDISNRGISSGDDMKQMVAEIKHKKELEDDCRKLAEKLAQQLQFENDSKQEAILQKCDEASKSGVFSDDLKHMEDELKHQKELDEDNTKLAENVEQQLQFESDSKQEAILQKCKKASKGDLFSDGLKHTEDELKHLKELDEDNRKLAENVEQQLQFESDSPRGADIQSTPNITDEITKIYKSLRPRPGTEIIEAAQSRVNNIEQEGKVAIEAICNQQKPQHTSQEIFNIFKMAQKTVVEYWTAERKREASTEYLNLLDLERVHDQINKDVRK
ncbi:hypothetical protein FRX31_031261, partial [Thalictrum thalictroides]